jgi:uncharacterized protein DUF4255
MSNAQVIAATTATLRRLLLAGIPARDTAIPEVTVTTLPPDKVGADLTKPWLNLFLYQTAVNAAFRNRDATQARPGEQPRPPLALDLHYMLTAYGQVTPDDGDFSHRVLGAAVSVLHDHPVLGPGELVGALTTDPIEPPVERLRISPIPTTLEEMSKLWTTFQTNYRLSTVYEVSVVLIESDLASPSALPVLQRGPGDRGVTAAAAAAPLLVRAVPPGRQPAVRLGETFTLEGRRLGAAGLRLRVRSSHFAAPILLAPEPGATDDRVAVRLPAAGAPGAMAEWAPGFYTVQALVRPEGLPEISSNAVPFALAPAIALSANAAPAGELALTVSCAPRLREGQSALLVLGDRTAVERQRTDPADPAQPTRCVFDVAGAAGERFVVRLRADGVDSVPVDPADPLRFDPAQTLSFQ